MNLPKDFEQYTRRLMGDALYDTLCRGLDDVPPVSIRLNPFKCGGAAMAATRGEAGVPWCAEGVYLRERPNFTFDPLLHAGLYYVQEASSMFVAHVLRSLVSGPVLALDLCAAPGGKSTCAMGALPAGSVLCANEPVKPRAQILAENVLKFGHPDIIVTANFAADYARTRLDFDIILADVPCSGEGMFRKDEGAVAEWSADNVERCRRLQRDIVADIWPRLKPGGLLLYSTCTFNARENEENAEWIADQLGADFVEIPVEAAWNITGSLTDDRPMYRFIPGKTRGEGLFMAVLRKRGGVAPLPLQGAAKAGSVRVDERQLKGLRILAHGIAGPTVKGKSIIPDHSEALSILYNKEKYPAAELSYEQAMAYLRHEAVTLPPAVPRGIVAVSYGGHPLGFAKNIGTRANNLYPAEWKVKSGHVPDEAPHIINEDN